jgi:hypothetical protein
MLQRDPIKSNHFEVMKTSLVTITAVAVTLLAGSAFADDAKADGKCEMMKKTNPTQIADQTELNKLVLEMNSNVGEKKLAAMAAILTRLVEQANAKVPAPANNDTPKAEEHHH